MASAASASSTGWISTSPLEHEPGRTMTHSLSGRPRQTRVLASHPERDARRDVALAGAASPQVEHIHAPRAGMRLGVKGIAVPASNARYRRRQEPLPAREPNPAHFTPPSEHGLGVRPSSRSYPVPADQTSDPCCCLQPARAGRATTRPYTDSGLPVCLRSSGSRGAAGAIGSS